MANLTQEHERELARVIAAANRLEASRRALREVALDAVEAGVPQTRVAAAADIGRMTLWRWLNNDEEDE